MTVVKRKPGKFAKLFPQSDPRCVSRTKQCFTKDADINVIIGRHIKGGPLGSGEVATRQGIFADVSSGDSFRDILDKTRVAQQAFEGLSSDVRSRFANDVSKLLDFVCDEANRDEAIELGLLPPDKPAVKPAPEPVPAPVPEPVPVAVPEPSDEASDA